MFLIPRTRRRAGLCLSALFLLAPAFVAQPGHEDDFYRAYYLEQEEGRLEEAVALYREVANDRSAAKELRHEARQRADGLAEDLASSDFARLMPHDSLLFLELSRPGAQLEQLLEELGLLGAVREDGTYGVSPTLVESLLGMRGAAVAVTGIDPRGGRPNGVVVVHPGDLDLVRGLIETALPAGAMPVDAIDGFPTWNVEGEAFVTLTHRLLIASPDPAQIEGVVARLQGDDDECFADNPNVQRALEARGQGILSFCVNVEPILPMAQFMLQQAAEQDPGAAMALSFLDVESLRCLSGHVGFDDDGLGMEMALELAEGHRNLVFNLMRSEQVTKKTLTGIPEGAAFFFASAFNPAGPVAPILADSSGQPVVTMMDFGRELFGNLIDMSLFALAPDHGGSGGQIPDVAAVMRVNDPTRSMALWDFALDLATQGSSEGRVSARSVEIAGAPARAYQIEGVPVFVAQDGNRLIVSPSEGAIAHAIDAAHGRGSVLDDPLYATTIKRMGEGSVFMMMANPGRCAEIAVNFMPPGDVAEIKPFIDLLSKTVFATDVEHSETTFALKGRLSRLPDVSGLVAAAIRGENPRGMLNGHGGSMNGHAKPKVAAASLNGGSDHGDETKKAAKAKPKQKSSASLSELEAEFEALARSDANVKKTAAIGERLVEVAGEDADYLNGFAWRLLTEEGTYQHRFDKLALAASKRSNKLTKFGNWMYLDTLAHAVFFQGDVEEAIDIEKKAIRLAAGDSRVGEAKAALERFVAARTKKVAAAAPIAVSGKTQSEAEAALEATLQALEQEGAKAKAAAQVKGDEVEKKKAKAKKIASTSPELSELRGKFDLLVQNGADRKSVLDLGEKILAHGAEDAEFLNDFAWALLTDTTYGQQYDVLALDMAMLSNEASDFKVWQHVDTLAHAVYQTGDVEGAIGLEETALELVGEDSRRSEVKAALARFQKALEEKIASSASTR